MFGFQFKIARLEYAHDRHVKTFNAEIQKHYKEAVRAFYTEALSHVPGYTGMSRASFTKLAAFLGESLDLEAVAPKKYITPIKNPGRGAQLGRYKFSIDGKARLTFEFNNGVPHYRVNDNIDATKYFSDGSRRHKGLRYLVGHGRQYFLLKTPGPYNSMLLGRQAFNKYLKTIPKRLTKISAFIRATDFAYAGDTY